MPKRNDIEKVLIIGSGPNVIGQGSEYDYFVTQALKVIKELGIESVVVNSNPSTLSTDISLADRTYIEPLDVKSLAAIIARENPSAIIPTLGGQKALNLCSELSRAGILEKNDVKILGVSSDTINVSENRTVFKNLMLELGLTMAKSSAAHNIDEAEGIAKYLNYPVVVRPAFTTGGFGGGLVYNIEELRDVVSRGIAASMVRNVLIEEAVLGWKELEVEALKDSMGNIVITGIIENVDPMGVHTGDSVAVMPPLTLSEKVVTRLKEATRKIVGALNVIGSLNVQFAYSQAEDKLVVVEVNLRASRTTALVSKATGMPLADIATRLIIGINLDEIKTSQSGLTLDGYEPDIDYVVVKMPCWSMEKFKGSIDKLGTQMKSVGEVMAIGGTFKEALNKAVLSLENGRYGLNTNNNASLEEIYSLLRCPSSERYYNIYQALIKGGSAEYISELTGIDKYFINEINELVKLEKELRSRECIISSSKIDESLLKQAKQYGFSDKYLASICNLKEVDISNYRITHNINQSYGNVSYNGALYSTYKSKVSYDNSSKSKKIIILGSGPNRIGQGAEFDYCVVHSAQAARAMGYEAIIINSNPAAVSTDHTQGNKVYIEPMTKEVIMAIASREKPIGIISCFGGHTPYTLTAELVDAGVNILGMNKENIALTENKEDFKMLLDTLDIAMPNAGVARTNEEAQRVASRVGYPVIVRPQYVMGGRGMEIIHESEGLRRYMLSSNNNETVSIEKFLSDAIEVEVDAICSNNEVFVPQLIEHIEYAGIHSGDSDCLIPASEKLNSRLITDTATKLCKALKVKGMVNIKFSVFNDNVYLLEARVRSSRSVSLTTKVSGINLPKIATEVLLSDNSDRKILELRPKKLNYCAVKASVFPFEMFQEVDPMLGPEMRSSGSVVGFASNIGEAYFKAQAATNANIPTSGTVMISVDDTKKKAVESVAQEFIKLGFKVVSTSGTYNHLISKGIQATKVDKMFEGRPNIADILINKEVNLIVNTPSGIKSEYDDSYIRKITIRHRICYITTIEAANAAINGIKEAKSGKSLIKPLQSYYS